MRHPFAFLAAAAFAAVPAFAGNGTVSLAAGSRTVIAFSRPVATLYIADPAVADVHAIDRQHISLAAKARGTTEFLALDANGVTVMSRKVVVTGGFAARSGGPGWAVTLQKGGERIVYACSDAKCLAGERTGTPQGAGPAANGAAGPVQQITITTPVPQAPAPIPAAQKPK
jgi:hypothetical protein